ncbi:MAG: glycosyl hydrolase family 18 protein [Candidatus Vogelbacteria bacterium]|nr:glycosyl hydrolase family 18 protein [Candidatus Vogelbacteria bacterium]
MKRILLVTFLVSFAFPASAAGLKYAAWIPYWKKSAGVAETTANLKQLTEISPFSYTVNAGGELKDTAKLAEAPWPELFRVARVKKVKILPSILWTDSVAIDRTLRATGTRRAQITAIMAEVKKYSFDGIDIDYENKFASTSPYFSLFLRELGTDLRARGKTLSCTIEARTPPSSRYLTVPAKLEYANDYKALNKYCDQVRLMTYDQGTVDIKLNLARRRGGYYYPIADPTWVRKVLDLAVKDISPTKIMLGVSTYGYELEITDKTKFFDYEQIRSLSYKDFLALSVQVKRPIWRDNAGEAYLTYTSTTTGKVRFVSFSDASAIAAKVRIAKQYGLRGVAIFKVDGESDNYWPYLK